MKQIQIQIVAISESFFLLAKKSYSTADKYDPLRSQWKGFIHYPGFFFFFKSVECCFSAYTEKKQTRKLKQTTRPYGVSSQIKFILITQKVISGNEKKEWPLVIYYPKLGFNHHTTEKPYQEKSLNWKTLASTSLCFEVSNPLANAHAVSINAFNKYRVLNRTSVNAHLSKSSPPVTSSRIREISVSVSKISFRRICKPHREKQRRETMLQITFYVKKNAILVWQNSGYIKSRNLILFRNACIANNSSQWLL